MECCIVCCWYFYNSINNYPTDLPGREMTAAALMITKHKTGNILNLTKTNIGRASPSSWTKMLALNFLISVREWSGIMRAFLIWSDDQWDDCPEERKNSLTDGASFCISPDQTGPGRLAQICLSGSGCNWLGGTLLGSPSAQCSILLYWLWDCWMAKTNQDQSYSRVKIDLIGAVMID